MWKPIKPQWNWKATTKELFYTLELKKANQFRLKEFWPSWERREKITNRFWKKRKRKPRQAAIRLRTKKSYLKKRPTKKKPSLKTRKNNQTINLQTLQKMPNCPKAPKQFVCH